MKGKTKQLSLKSVKKISKVREDSSQIIDNIKEYDYKEPAKKVGRRFLKARRKTIAFYRRPLKDISHLSIVLVIIVTLMSGFSASFSTANQVQVNPFAEEKISSKELYLSSTEKRILEADTVTTIAYFHSQSLGDDAAVITEELNNKAAIVTNGDSYISSLPILTTDGGAGAPKNTITRYVVQNGDTLSGIAVKFSITTDTIRYANGLTDVDSLKPGQTLTILPVSGILHTVAAGHTLKAIAGRYGVSEAMIIAQNDLYGEEIKVGMQLVIPNADIPEIQQPKVATTPSRSTSTRSSNTGSYGSSRPVRGSGNFRFPTLIGPNGYYNGYHNWAIDVPNSIGTPIFAADGGRVVEARYGWNGGYGNTILIDHGNGFTTRYAHMSSLRVVGGYVSRGQVIGLMGSTGRSTGSHLHFEILINGARQNPTYYF